MSKLDKNTIKNLTVLSRIACSDEEQEKLLQDLAGILDYVELLKEVDTENVPPCNQVLPDLINVMREDHVGKTLPREKFLSNAPEHVGGLVRVPTIIKQG